MLRYTEPCPHESSSDLASAALQGDMGQSNVPSYLPAVSAFVLPSLIWVATLREMECVQQVWPPLPVCGEPQPGHSASSKSKAGVFTWHFPAAPQELCQRRAECSTSARRPPISVQKSFLSVLLEGHNPTCVGIFKFFIFFTESLMKNSLEVNWSEPLHEGGKIHHRIKMMLKFEVSVHASCGSTNFAGSTL